MSPSLIGAAALLGLAGSLHCAAMCGAFAVISKSHPAWHIGKAAAYAALGAVAGTVGALGGLGGWAGPARIGIGVVASLALLLGVRQLLGAGRTRPPARPFGPLTRVLRSSAAEPERSPVARNLLFGLANGLLPCGLVYAALGLAAAAGTPAGGGAVMLGLAAGSAPALIATSLGSRSLRQWGQRRQLRAAAAALALGVGLTSIWIRVPLTDAKSVPCHTPERDSVPSSTDQSPP